MDENGKDVLMHVGDEILAAWPLDEASAMVSFDSLSACVGVVLLEVDQKDMPIKAWNVRGNHVFAARSARQSVEAYIDRDGKSGMLPENLNADDAVELADFELEMVDPVTRRSFQELLSLAQKASYLGELK
jgi:hypothetical protein